jgi:hypothetical protein
MKNSTEKLDYIYLVSKLLAVNTALLPGSVLNVQIFAVGSGFAFRARHQL